MRPAWLALCVSVGAFLPFRTAEAQTARGAEITRYEARSLADEGQRLFEAGDYRGAIARLREAEAKFAAPTIKLALAEAHEKLRELREARAVYQQIADAPLDRSAPAEFHEAFATAKGALERLDEAIPRLVVELIGPPPPMLSLALDGTAIAPSARAIKVNPGKHTLSIEMSGQPAETRSVELKEGETRRIQLRWAKLSEAKAPEPSTPSPDAPSPAPGRSYAAPAVAFGVGGAGLVLGAIAGGVALSRMAGFQKLCGPELACPPSMSGDLDGAKIAGHVSTVGFAVAGAGAALGALLLVLPAGKGTPASVGVGPAGVVVTGTF
jgi:hypothetical protein